MIEVNQLTKVYGSTLAVDHISFSVPKGQIVGFLGPNGAGKSTTIRMLSCYLPPTSGGATINGFDIFHQSTKVRESLGYLPESCPLYTEMRVQEYLEFRAALRKMARQERLARIEYVLERCWLKHVRRKVIGHLSKGYRQRVGLADSMLHNPPMLILDEPTVGLDPTQIRETRKLIKELGGDHTVMLSTHILPEVEAVCDRAIFIAGGRVVAQGSPDELRESRKLQARVLVETKAPEQELIDAMRQLDGIVESTIADRSVDGWFTIALTQTPAADRRNDIARTITGRGWPLREIRLERATLEEFFVQVTANQAVAQVAPTEMERAAVSA